MPQIEQFTKELNLPGPIASYLRAVNTGAREEFPASFADDAVVVDVNRELRGLDAITAWAGADIFGAQCTSTSWTSQSARDEPSSESRSTERSIERDYPILS